MTSLADGVGLASSASWGIRVAGRTCSRAARSRPARAWAMRASFAPIGWCAKHWPRLFFALMAVTSASDELARGIHPAAPEQGLEVALDAPATRSAVPTTVARDPGPRLPRPVEFAAYIVASEALANIAKYAHATTATVHLRRTGRSATIEITDDGVGADPAAGSGLRGLTDRVEALHGPFRVVSPPGGGTVVTAELPILDDTTAPP